MIKFIKYYFWFLKTSCDFLNENIYRVFRQGGLKKAYVHAKDMCVWDKMSPEQREYWYLNTDRTMKF